MPFFRRKTDKEKKAPASPALGAGGAAGGAARCRVLSDTTGDHESLDIPNGIVSAQGEDRTPYAWGQRPKSLLLDPNYSAPGTDGFMVLNDPLKPQTPMITSSRLSKTFGEVLHDKDALPYFREFMKSQNVEHIIQFWLDAESFQASSWTRIRSQSVKSQTKSAASSTSGTPLHAATGADLNNTKSAASSASGTPLHAAASADTNNTHSATTSTGPTPTHTTKDANNTGSPKESSCSCGKGSKCANCDKICRDSESARSNNCDKGEGHSEGHPVQSVSAEGSGTSQDAINGAKPAGQVPSNHSNPPDTDSNQSDSSKLCSSSLPIETTQVSISQSSQTSRDSAREQGAPPGVELQSGGAGSSGGSPESPTTRSQPPPTTAPPPRSPPADTDSFHTKLKKSIQRDAVSIFSKYLSHDASHPIGITEQLRNEVMSKMCGEDGEVDPGSFVSAQEFARRLMDEDYFPGFLSSEFHCKHQVDLLTTTNVNLADILYNDVAMFYFSEFMEQESGSKLLQCFLAIHNFQEQLTEQYGSYDGSMAQSDAMVIYDKYFSLQATSPLGFNDDVRFEVEGNICREGGPLPDCFATAKRQVLRTIDKVYFPQFVRSDLYFKYLGELINTVQTQDIPGIKRKRTGSDASSEHSLGSHSTGSEKLTISAKNTLLASANQTVSHMRKAFNKVDDDMQIDSALFNPDELWKRPQAGKLTLGKINELGQFVSEVEPEPDMEKKKKGTFILKKRKEKEKTQEEMAQQIAQMIISDINSATGCDIPTLPQGEGHQGQSEGQGHDSDMLKESSLISMSFGGSAL